MLKTAECVTPKHPDKLCDRISDAILDACLTEDPNTRAAIETMGGHGIITITGELTTEAYVNAREIAQKIAGSQYGVQVNIAQQSPEISGGVDTGGAGDQGIMVGYATSQNANMLPWEVFLARSLCKFLYEEFPVDGKTQITINEKNEIVSVVASFQKTSENTLESLVRKWAEGARTVEEGFEIFANPAGRWEQGGFEADTGLTGRKLAVDNYGPQIPIGGGCFSGKDASKVDRSAAYAARAAAIEKMREFKATHPICGEIEVFVKLAYAIGVAEPVMATYEVRGIPDPEEKTLNGTIFEQGELDKAEFTPKKIISKFRLFEPIFEKTAEWGHFGNEDFPWEKFSFFFSAQ